MRRFRFGLKTILAMTAVVAASCFAYRKYQSHLERVQLRRLRDGFLRWTESTDRSDRKVHSYFNLNSASDLKIVAASKTRQPFFVANSRFAVRAGSTPGLVFGPMLNRPDPNRFYVYPAKKWVETPDEVIDEWNAWHRTKY